MQNKNNKQKKIPFNQVDVQGKELNYISKVLDNGNLSGDGKYTLLCNKKIENELGVKKSLLTTSCTHALEMSAILLNIKPGDEVIVPSFTFVSTINSFVIRGAKPVFIDIHNDTLNMNENHLQKLINKNTKAIIPVHYAGVGCEMDQILKIAEKNNLNIIEDNAHGLFGKYKNKHLGTFGTFATQSFHETKNFTCGEGGALIINDEQYIERAEIIREKGTNRSRFFRGQVDKYTWVDIGSSYLPSDLLAAMLYAQFEERDKIQEKRKVIWDFYFKNLKKWSEENNVKLPYVPKNCDQSYHMFYLIMPSLKHREFFINFLMEKNISSVFHYLPLNTSEMGKRYGAKKGDCPVSEEISDTLVRLPFYNNLDLNKLDYIVDIITNCNFSI
jgi:dTDP-4-amino-4,6-dideoxygalactose transaminase